MVEATIPTSEMVYIQYEPKQSFIIILGVNDSDKKKKFISQLIKDI